MESRKNKKKTFKVREARMSIKDFGPMKKALCWDAE